MMVNHNGKPIPLWTRDFIAIWFSNFCIFVSFHMLVPTFPVYIADMGGEELAIGFAVTIFTFSSLLIRPYAGKSLDLFGRRQVLMVGLVVLLVSAFSYFWMATLALVFIFRFMHGVGWGIVTTATGTIVSDIIPPEKRGEGMGYYGLSNNLSMSLGPVFGIWVMNEWGFPFLFSVSVTLALCSLLLSQLIRLQPQTEPATLGQLKKVFVTSGLIEKSVLLPAVLMTLMAGSYGGIVTFITLFGKEIGIENVGMFFVTMAIISMITRPLSGILYDRKGHPWALIPGAVFLGVGLTILSYTSSLSSLVAAAICYGLGYGMVHPALHAWTVQMIPMHRRGAANGTFYSAIDLGIGSGALLSGAVANVTGYALMYRLTVLLALLFLIIYCFYLRKERARKQA